MKSLTFALAGWAVALCHALPVDVKTTRDVQIARDLELDTDLEGRTVNLFRNDLENGDSSDCPDAILIYARGSTEPGNMVSPFLSLHCKNRLLTQSRA